jgi:hypothetical protein
MVPPNARFSRRRERSEPRAAGTGRSTNSSCERDGAARCTFGPDDQAKRSRPDRSLGRRPGRPQHSAQQPASTGGRPYGVALKQHSEVAPELISEAGRPALDRLVLLVRLERVQISIRLIDVKRIVIIQYLRQLRKTAGVLRGMNTA